MSSGLLFLAHRIPYPPNKGDKIRSFHILRHLAERHSVHLAAFVDDPADWAYADVLRELCHDVLLEGISPRWRRVRSLTGLFTGQPLGVPYYEHPRIAAWVDRKLSGKDIQKVFVYSSTMAQYVMRAPEHVRVILDFVDVDSEKWRQYAQRHPGPLGWIYAREGRRLLRLEREAAKRADRTLFVTEQEADLFRTLAPQLASKVDFVENGVDTTYFNPEQAGVDPYPADCEALVFTGAMDYWANVDAVTWFAREVFPVIRARRPRACFYIVGIRPTESVLELGTLSGVTVTGAVPDVRPYVAHAVAAVAPLRIARGIQNKVLEAMAMARPVLATPQAVEGIEVNDRQLALVSEDPTVLAEKALELLDRGDHGNQGGLGRGLVERRYSWARHLRRLDEILESLARAPGSEMLTGTTGQSL